MAEHPKRPSDELAAGSVPQTADRPDRELADSDIERVAGGKKSPERTVKQRGSHTDSSGNTYTCSEKTGIATRIQVNDRDVVIGEQKKK